MLSSASGPDLWAAVRGAVQDAGFGGAMLVDAHTLEARRTRAWLQTQKLTVRVERAGHGQALVTLWVRPEATLLGQARDLGWSRRHANAVLTAIPGATPLS